MKEILKERIILGIDPGTNVLGYGVVKQKSNNLELLTIGVMDLKKYSEHFQKLQQIFHRTLWLIDEFKPLEMAIEAPFFGKNVQSMLKLGRAQGVAMSAALFRKIPIYEYAPRKIKMAITGNGNASKEQVASLLQRFVKIPVLPEQLDATDGLAAAVCHCFQNKVTESIKSSSGWKDFIAKNPDRIL